MRFAALLLVWGFSAAPVGGAEDASWRLKVDYRNIKLATDRCKTIRRSCLAFAEEPIPAADWAWILSGLSAEERELMRRRYSIPPEAMTGANAAAVRRSRPRGDDYRDAVGSTPAGFREAAAARVARVAGAAPEAPRLPPARAGAPPAAARRAPGARRPQPPPAPAAGVPPQRLARLAAPFARAAESGRFDAASLGEALGWAKANPPANEAEERLRRRTKSLRKLLGENLSPGDRAMVRSLAKDAGLSLDDRQEANLVKAVERGLSWGDKLRLLPYL